MSRAFETLIGAAVGLGIFFGFVAWLEAKYPPQLEVPDHGSTMIYYKPPPENKCLWGWRELKQRVEYRCL